MKYRNYFTVVAVRLDGTHLVHADNVDKTHIRTIIKQWCNPKGKSYHIDSEGKMHVLTQLYLRFYAFDSEGYFVQYDATGKPMPAFGKVKK